MFSPFSGKLLPVCPGRNTGSPSPCFCRFQNNGPASGTLVTPDLTVPRTVSESIHFPVPPLVVSIIVIIKIISFTILFPFFI
ncbi:hypothetical protein EC2762100_5304 [Escherichia coli 2762100]|nr:hypothetical protein EC2762100_5304 [Escherichia coli 2762100]